MLYSALYRCMFISTEMTSGQTSLTLICLIGILGRVWTSHLHAAGSVDDAKNLRTKLFTTDGYDKKVRPSKSYTEPTNVYVSFHLCTINGLDESAEKLTTTGYLVLSWYDTELVWNISDFGNMSYTYFPQDDVWKPDMALKNSVKQYKEMGVETLNVFVDYYGYILWYPFQLFESFCAIDITHFPFDIQTCKFKFGAWSYSKSEVNMSVYGEGIDISEFETNSEWDIIGSDDEMEESSEESLVIFILKLKRKPRFMMLNVILPTVMLSTLSVLTFLLPCDSGEKSCYAVTVFLSFSVFLTIVSSSLPQNSDTISLFSVYLVIQTGQSTLITIIAMALIRMSLFKQETPIPKFLICLVQCLNCQSCSNKSAKISPTENRIELITVHEGFESMNAEADTDALASHDKDIIIDWKGVVNALDIFFLTFFSLFTVISTVACLGIASATH